MTCRFLSPAAREAAEAAAQYEDLSPGLGIGFALELERTLSRILTHPEAWGRVSGNHRRCRMRRFPYGVIYSIHADEIVVAAVFHLSRLPGSWRRGD